MPWYSIRYSLREMVIARGLLPCVTIHTGQKVFNPRQNQICSCQVEIPKKAGEKNLKLQLKVFESPNGPLSTPPQRPCHAPKLSPPPNSPLSSRVTATSTVSETDSDPEDSFPVTPDSKCLGSAYYHLTPPSKAELWTSSPYWADLTVTVNQELRTARAEHNAQALLNALVTKQSLSRVAEDTQYLNAVRQHNKASLRETDAQLNLLKDHIVQGLPARDIYQDTCSPETLQISTQTNVFFINGLKVSEYIDNSALTEQERIQNEHSCSCTHCHFTHIGGLGAPTTGHTQWSHEILTDMIDIDVMHFPKCGLNKPHCHRLRNFGTCLPSVCSSFNITSDYLAWRMILAVSLSKDSMFHSAHDYLNGFKACASLLLVVLQNEFACVVKQQLSYCSRIVLLLLVTNFSSTGQPLAGDSEFYPNHDNNLENACIETVLLQPSLSQPGYYGHQHDGQAQASGSSSCQTHMPPPTNDPIYHDNNVYDPSTNPFATVAVMPMPLPWHVPSYPQVQVPPHLLGYDQPPANYYQFYGNINHSSSPAGLQMPIYSMPPSPPHPPNHDLEITFDVLYPPSNTIVHDLFELEAPTFMHPPDDQVPEMRDDIADINPMQSHIVSVQPRYPSSSLSAFLPEFVQPVLSKDGDALLPTGAEDKYDRDESLQEPVAGTENPEDDSTFHYYWRPSDRRGRKGKGGLKRAARLHLLFDDKNKMHQRIVRSAKRAIMKHALNVTALTEEGDRVTLAANKLKEAAQKRMGEKQGIKWASYNSGMLYMILSEPCKSIMQMCRKHVDNLVLDGFSLRLSIWSGASKFAHQETLIAGLLDDQIFPPKFVMRLGTNDEVYFLENEVVLNVMLNTIRELDLCEYVEELDSLACIAAVAVHCALEKVKRRISTDVEFSGTAFKGLYKKLMDYIEGTIKKCPRLRKRWENYKKCIKTRLAQYK
ncbi:hypothetical protein F4604DRAFT_1682170 [Suillus subluteus]|nr:hypothetical protein F4604DRAFT_1682170 [Suillus subluteus]